MTKRINIVLPEATIQTIDRMAKPGQRSRFIDHAVQHFVAHQSTEALRARLEQTAARDRDLDGEVNAEWAAVDQQAWRKLEKATRSPQPATRSAAKSTSRPSTRR